MSSTQYAWQNRHHHHLGKEWGSHAEAHISHGRVVGWIDSASNTIDHRVLFKISTGDGFEVWDEPTLQARLVLEAEIESGVAAGGSRTRDGGSRTRDSASFTKVLPEVRNSLLAEQRGIRAPDGLLVDAARQLLSTTRGVVRGRAAAASTLIPPYLLERPLAAPPHPPTFVVPLPLPQPIMVLSELGKEELAALQTLTETTRAGPKPSDGRYEFPLMDKLEIKDWEPNKGCVFVHRGGFTKGGTP